MSGTEFQHWLALREIDPWDESRADLRAGIVASVVANCHSNGRTFKPSDFIPKYEVVEREPKSDDELMSTAVMITAMLGGTVSRKVG